MREVAIVGGGPAGLSAALILGRCRRDVVVIDSGAYRNADAREMHCFLTRDATPPGELRRIGREELAQYPTVELLEAEVIDAANDVGGKLLTLAGGKTVMCRAVLVATGIVDVLPTIRGARELHGRRLFSCPYCDGWEVRGRPLAAFSFPDDRGARFALTLKRWSDDVILCTGGVPMELGPDMKVRVAVAGIAIDERPVAELAELTVTRR